MKVISNSVLYSGHILRAKDETFEIDDVAAEELRAAGKVRLPNPPKVQYDTKVLVPGQAPQVSAREPFRDVPVPNAEPTTVDSEGNRVLSSSNIFERPTADSRGRRRRSGSDSE